eukprot:3846026-Prymnesium_polylepis.1
MPPRSGRETSARTVCAPKSPYPVPTPFRSIPAAWRRIPEKFQPWYVPSTQLSPHPCMGFVRCEARWVAADGVV